MATKTEIERRAFALWERDGRPEGRAMEHWLRAETELEPARESNPDLHAGEPSVSREGAGEPAAVPEAPTPPNPATARPRKPRKPPAAKAPAPEAHDIPAPETLQPESPSSRATRKPSAKRAAKPASRQDPKP